jgi:taurine dioxygenase
VATAAHARTTVLPTAVKLAGSLGARVEGLDLSLPIDDETMEWVRAAFLEHCVLVFPRQAITPEQQVEFAARWGELERSAKPTADSPLLTEVAEAGSRQRHTDRWHSDMSFQECPPMASVLMARVLPSAGGDTMFANQYLAYEALSPGMQRLCDGLRAIHSGHPFAAVRGWNEETTPWQSHPVVRTHPETGRRALFVNTVFTTRFDDMTEAESAPLLTWLYAHCAQPNLTFRHHWSVGDLIMWDNRCVQHYAIHDYSGARRMHRASVSGDRPF